MLTVKEGQGRLGLSFFVRLVGLVAEVVCASRRTRAGLRFEEPLASQVV